MGFGKFERLVGHLGATGLIVLAAGSGFGAVAQQNERVPVNGMGSVDAGAAGAVSERSGGQVIRLGAPGTLKTNGVATTTEDALGQMASRAGVIFVGEVTAVRLPRGVAGSPEDASEGVVEVVFRVDEAVFGTTTGAEYVVREWAGLWAGGVARYKVGQRLLMLLHTPDAQGLSSPVNGMDGAIGVFGVGVAPGPDDATITPGSWAADLRWVQAKTLRATDAVPLSPADLAVLRGGQGETPESGNGGVLRATVVAAGAATGLAADPAPGRVILPDQAVVWQRAHPMLEQSAAASLESVLAVCRQWGQQHAGSQ